MDGRYEGLTLFLWISLLFFSNLRVDGVDLKEATNRLELISM